MPGGELAARLLSRWRYERQRWQIVVGGLRLGLSPRSRRAVLCIGDSHIEPMLDVRQSSALPATSVSVVWVGGATASGIANPNSKTRALPRFIGALRVTTRGYWVMSCLGEVDAGFLVFTGGDPVERCNSALQKYFAFLEAQVLAHRRKLLVVTVVPPLIEDYVTWEGLHGQRRDADATWQERCDMTVYWNRALARWCREHDVPLLDLWTRVTEPTTGRALAEYANEDERNHHLDRELHKRELVSLLRENGFR